MIVGSSLPPLYNAVTGKFSLSAAFKIASGTAAILGVLGLIVGYGTRYGEIQSKLAQHSEAVVSLRRSLKEEQRTHQKDVLRLYEELHHQDKVMTELRVALSLMLENQTRQARYQAKEAVRRANALSQQVVPTKDDEEQEQEP